MPEFHSAFAATLFGDDDAALPWVAKADIHRLRVYRNTVFKGLSEAVMASFPSLGKCLPSETFSALALGFARVQTPSTPILADYGDDFAEWLETTEVGQAEPHLIDLARLDRLWTEAHMAADIDTATPEVLATWTSENYVSWAPGLIPSARLAAFDNGLPSLWAQLRAGDLLEELTLGSASEAVLIWRPDEVVIWRILDAASHAFLAAIHAGDTLPAAAAAAVDVDPNTDIATLFAEMLTARVLRGPL